MVSSKTVVGCVVTCMASASAVVFAARDRAQAPARPDVPVFRRVAGLSSKALTLKIQPRGWQTMEDVPTGGADFPASFFTYFNEYCSAEVVGEYAVLTAAHCLYARTQSVKFEFDGKLIEGTCEQSDDFNDQTFRADWALCAMTGSFKGILFEVVNTSATLVERDDSLLITGFSGTDSTRPTLTPEKAEIKEPPSDGDDRIILKQRTLAFGQSGGAAFALYGDSPPNRVVVAVNSNVTEMQDRLSGFASEAGMNFLRKWAKHHPAAWICGAYSTATVESGCRNDPPPNALLIP